MYGSDIKAGDSVRKERIPGNQKNLLCVGEREQTNKNQNFPTSIYKGSKEGKKPMTCIIL